MTISNVNLAGIRQILSSGWFLNSSYDEGRFDKPYTGGDRNEYLKGRADKEHYNNATKGNQPKGSSGGGINPDGRAGGFWGKLILFCAFLLLAIPSFFTALLAGTVLFLIFKKKPDFKSAQMGNLYLAAFWGMLAYLVTAAFMSYFFPMADFRYLSTGDYHIEKTMFYFFSIADPEYIEPLSLLKFHLPCLLVAALVVNMKMGNLLGNLSFGKSLSIVTLILIPCFVGLLYFMREVLPSQLQYFMTII